MRYAVLLSPHANVRYDAAQRELVKSELEILLGDAHPVEVTELGGAQFLCFDAPEEAFFKRLAYFLSAAYVVFEMRDGLLRPIENPNEVYVPDDLSGVLKYKGKTNEVFTSLLINLAVFSSDYANKFDQKLQVLDPVCGRGTGLFEALKKGYDAYGVEIDKKDTDELTRYFKKYLEFHRYKHTVSQQNLTVGGKVGGARTAFEFAPDAQMLKQKPAKLTVVQGNSANCPAFFKNAQFHAIAADLPYGVQHAGQDGKRPIPPALLLEKLAPSWVKVLKPGGAIAVSYNVNTLSTHKARGILSALGLRVMEGGAYDRLEHWVEQAVTRDVTVAVLE